MDFGYIHGKRAHFRVVIVAVSDFQKLNHRYWGANNYKGKLWQRENFLDPSNVFFFSRRGKKQHINTTSTQPRQQPRADGVTAESRWCGSCTTAARGRAARQSAGGGQVPGRPARGTTPARPAIRTASAPQVAPPAVPQGRPDAATGVQTQDTRPGSRRVSHNLARKAEKTAAPGRGCATATARYRISPPHITGAPARHRISSGRQHMTGSPLAGSHSRENWCRIGDGWSGGLTRRQPDRSAGTPARTSVGEVGCGRPMIG